MTMTEEEYHSELVNRGITRLFQEWTPDEKSARIIYHDGVSMQLSMVDDNKITFFRPAASKAYSTSYCHTIIYKELSDIMGHGLKRIRFEEFPEDCQDIIRMMLV